jgi:virginiamycin B lyase
MEVDVRDEEQLGTCRKKISEARQLRFFSLVVVSVLLASGLTSFADAQVVITEYPITTPSSAPFWITTGPDGNLWFTEKDANKIGRMTPAGVVTGEFPVLTPDPEGPRIITSGPDGNLWFTEEGADKIGQITPSGTVTEFQVPTPAATLGGITTGPDGALWFTEITANKIGRITTAGAFTEYPITTPASGVRDITAGSDGKLWFCERDANQIGTISTSGTVHEYPVTTPGAQPGSIAPGSDGNLWFTEEALNTVGRITTAGVITEFPGLAGSGGFSIAAGPDGNLWETEQTRNLIARITTAGVITEYPVPTPSSLPRGICAGPDHNVWFVQRGSNQVAKVGIPKQFFTITPCRVADTRGPAGPYGAPSLSGGADRTFVIGGQCGIPSNAAGVSFNFTVTNGTGGGDVRVFPGSTPRPLISTLNWSAGQTRANNAVTALGPAGDITVHTDEPGGTVDFIIDVNGYFSF